MDKLDETSLRYLAAEARNVFYEETLANILRYIDQKGGFSVKTPLTREVEDAKLAATEIACRILKQDGVLRGDGDHVNAYDFVAHEIYNVVQYGLSKYPKRRMRSADWAAIIIRYVWEKKYGHFPSDALFWALLLVVDAIITDPPQFKKLVRMIRRNRIPDKYRKMWGVPDK